MTAEPSARALAGDAAPGRLRVAMVAGPARPDRDGVSDYVAHLVVALADVGVQAAQVPVRPHGAPAADEATPSPGRGGCRRRIRGARRQLSSSLRSLAAVVDAARRVRRARPDLVHVQFAPSAYRFSGMPGLLPLLLPRGTPLVTTLHEYGWWAVPAWVPDRVWRSLERLGWWDRETGRLVPASSALVVTNPAHGGELRERMRRDPVQVPIAANVEAAAAPDSRDEVRARFGVPADAPLVAFFGFVHPVKGVRYVIEALPTLRASHPGLHLLVLGGFTSQALPEQEARAFRRELEDLAVAAGVEDAVTFTGHLPAADVSAALHVADMAVLPFTYGVTTKSGALLTVLAHGLPTAVTEADEPDPELRDGDAVAVIPARRDTAAVTTTLLRLLDDPKLQARVAAGGRRVAARHAWPQIAAAHRDLYRQVLATGSGAGRVRRPGSSRG